MYGAVSLGEPVTPQTGLNCRQHQELGRRPYQPARRARWVAKADVASQGATNRASVDPPQKRRVFCLCSPN